MVDLAIERRNEFYFEIGCILAITSAKSKDAWRINGQPIRLKDLLVFARVAEETYVRIAAQLALLLLDLVLDGKVEAGRERLLEQSRCHIFFRRLTCVQADGTFTLIIIAFFKAENECFLVAIVLVWMGPFLKATLLIIVESFIEVDFPGVAVV